jgi:hypothetical protein
VTTFAAVAAAAAFTLTPTGEKAGSGQSRVTAARVQVGAPVLVVVAARPSLGMKETVPRLEMKAASIADGPVHGLFSTPVRV